MNHNALPTKKNVSPKNAPCAGSELSRKVASEIASLLKISDETEKVECGSKEADAALVSSGRINESQMMAVYAKASGIPLLDDDEVRNLEAFQNVTYDFLQANGCLPIIWDTENIVIAVANPYSAGQMSLLWRNVYDLSASFLLKVQQNLTTESEVTRVCMYVSGAIGDMIPKEDELGADAARQLGVRLAKGILRGMLDATRNPERFKMQSQKVGAFSRKISVPFRPSYRNNPEMLPSHYLDKTAVDLEIQCIAIGDVCFVGVPGEFCAELGAEIKWHSPFRKAYVAFGATAYHEYFCPANFLLQGGYEIVSGTFHIYRRLFDDSAAKMERHCRSVVQFDCMAAAMLICIIPTISIYCSVLQEGR